jgi:hypothetical protein
MEGMMSVLVASGLMLGLAVVIYWLLRGEPAPERRWMAAPLRPRPQRLYPEVAAQNLVVSRIFGYIGDMEIRGPQDPPRARLVYRAPSAPRVPVMTLERAAHVLRSSTTLAPREPSREDYVLPPMVWRGSPG